MNLNRESQEWKILEPQLRKLYGWLESRDARKVAGAVPAGEVTSTCPNQALTAHGYVPFSWHRYSISQSQATFT
jgi:hypothetical protein